MIRILRHLRLDFMNNGKLGNYFWYSLGEILLVVIGILIALQVNNWNVERIEKEEFDSYLLSISRNIEQDISEVEVTMGRRKETFEVVSKIMEAIHNGNLKSIPDTTILKGYAGSFVETYTQFNESGIQALKSSGYLGKLNNTVYEEALYSYYNMVEVVKGREKSLNEYIEAMEVEASRSGSVNPLIQYLRFPGSATIEDLQNMLMDPAVQSAMYRNTTVVRLRNEFYPELINRGKIFIKLVEGKI